MEGRYMLTVSEEELSLLKEVLAESSTQQWIEVSKAVPSLDWRSDRNKPDTTTTMNVTTSE